MCVGVGVHRACVRVYPCVCVCVSVLPAVLAQLSGRAHVFCRTACMSLSVSVCECVGHTWRTADMEYGRVLYLTLHHTQPTPTTEDRPVGLQVRCVRHLPT